MNKTISAAEANRQFSRVLREVREERASYTVTSHGEPVARIVPANPVRTAEEKSRRDEEWKQLLERLRTQPALNLGKWSRDEAYDDDVPDDPAK
ncbi:MAG TPA: type II toxin-antitoxin system prevent-host-death family antitoxin [Rhizomicrobium sp.]|jgi:prevent-host-death family protein|nr:type II toxin-antitoxin system prevent-host-death family antitoxin [Rhizomicrobium sp.]